MIHLLKNFIFDRSGRLEKRPGFKAEEMGMEPGLELDCLIAEKMMGWTRNNGKWTPPFDAVGLWTVECEAENIPRFSTDIAAAWRVVDKIKTKYAIGIHVGIYPADDEACLVHIGPNIKEPASSAPHAICLAALKALA